MDETALGFVGGDLRGKRLSLSITCGQYVAAIAKYNGVSLASQVSAPLLGLVERTAYHVSGEDRTGNAFDFIKGGLSDGDAFSEYGNTVWDVWLSSSLPFTHGPAQLLLYGSDDIRTALNRQNKDENN